MPRNKQVRVAVIGAGNMGRYHVRNYHELSESQLLALADPRPEAKELADEYGIEHFVDYKEMLDTVKPDAVTVAVPTPLHVEVGAEVLKRGIHCMMEKPIASTIAEANKLIALASKKNLVLSVGHIERYNPIIRKLKELIDQGRLGKITSIVCTRVGGFPKAMPKTNVIIDLAVHDIDIMSYLLGKKPRHVYSHGSRTLHANKIDSAEVLVDFGQASGFVQANWVTPVKVRTITVTGTKGYISGDYITQELHYYEHNVKRQGIGFDSVVTEISKSERTLIDVDIQEPLAVELQNFLRATIGKPAQVMDPRHARDALKTALQAVAVYEVVV